MPALVGGLVATIVMSALMAASWAMNLTEMPPMPLFVGGMMSEKPGRARAIGLMVHYLVMGTVVFGLIYGWLFALFDSASALTGGLVGLGHGIVVGLMMAMMSSIHPRIADTPGTHETQSPRAPLRFSDPRVFGVGWGAMTPVGLVVGHFVYGVVLALVYSWLV